ncbi:general secretion pathway protein GspK [Pulveribacter suum]|nr:general secretion pathway protein GspK [Pulveribacter suum]
MALVAVLWIVAALSVIATGLTQSLRLESRTVAHARQEAQAQALGDAAIQMTLQALLAGNQPVARLTRVEVSFHDVPMQVEVMPLSGLVDINRAAVPLLQRLFHVAGGLSPDAAEAAARAVVQAREQRDGKGAPRRFEAEEDLLRVPGIEYDLYARLSGLFTADLQGSGRVNPLAAPLEVLVVLAGGNKAMAAQMAARRDAGEAAVDTTALDPALIDAALSRRLRVQATVPMADGGFVQVARSVDLSARSPDGAPWHTFRMTSTVGRAYGGKS